MRLLPALLIACSLAMPAFAGGGGGEKPAQPEADPTLVDVPMLVAPVSVGDRLYHYAYMRVVLKAISSDMAWKAREKIPFIIDGMLRETHNASIALNNDPQQIDGDGLKTRLLSAANEAMGEKAFESLSFRDTIQTDDPAANQEMAAHSVPAPESKPESKPAAH